MRSPRARSTAIALAVALALVAAFAAGSAYGADRPATSPPEYVAPVAPYPFPPEVQAVAVLVELKRNIDIQTLEVFVADEAARAPQIPGSGEADPAPSASGPGPSDSCYGVIPDSIVNRESGGNPYIVNPSSGAYGCFQIIPSTWAASCSDLPRDVTGQRECASRLPSSAWGY